MSAAHAAGNSDGTEAELVNAGIEALGLNLTDAQQSQLLRLLDELTEWNKAYNLTAIRARAGMLTHHLLDSLSIAPYIVGPRVADIGTGAGFPGLPLAIARPEWRFALIDSNAKKIRFVTHVVRALGLDNVTPLAARAEAADSLGPFDTVVARALAPLKQIVEWARPLMGPGARLVAQKGKYPTDELAALPPGSGRVECRALSVPGLAAERHVVTLQT